MGNIGQIQFLVMFGAGYNEVVSKYFTIVIGKYEKINKSNPTGSFLAPKLIIQLMGIQFKSKPSLEYVCLVSAVSNNNYFTP